jgi:hypothetical protein
MADRRPSSTRIVQLELPTQATKALQRHVSSNQGNGSRSQSISSIAARLLARGLRRARGDERFALHWLVRDAIAAAASGEAFTALESVRAHLRKVPRILVDEALRELEQRGELRLEPSYNGDSVTQSQRDAGLRDPVRGLLLYVVPHPSAIRSALAPPRQASRHRTRAS